MPASKIPRGQQMTAAFANAGTSVTTGDLRPLIAILKGANPLFGAELDWVSGALCPQTDPESFYPEKGGSTREAKRVCRSCPVREPCLQFALDHDERFGIWGGVSERDRRRLAKAAGEGMCSKGLHPLEGGNVHTDSRGIRRCLACKAASPSRNQALNPRKAAA